MKKKKIGKDNFLSLDSRPNGRPLTGLQSVYALQVDSSEAAGEASLMFRINRRRFISGSSVVAASCVADLSFLTPLSHGAAANPQIDPDEVAFGPETDRLLRLLRETAAAECVPAFVKELRAGLSYQQFLTVLLPFVRWAFAFISRGG